jgi:DNA-binding response OmpR family regulator
LRLSDQRGRRTTRMVTQMEVNRVLVVDDRLAARDAGADAYLVKPFSSLRLLEAVRRLVDA